MRTFVLFLALMQTQPQVSTTNVIESLFSEADWKPGAEAASSVWKGTLGVLATLDFFGKPVPLEPTEIRSRWSDKYLYLLYICPYKTLYLTSNPVTSAETDKLWDRDVAEAFIGTDFEHIARYKEFQVSPQGEYVDLDINRDDAKASQGIGWQSGFLVAARVDEQKKIWYGEMRIPLSSLGVTAPRRGDQMRVGLYRIEGAEPNRVYVAWQPTGRKTFHEPSAFGRLVLK